jgi:hypothetical protein
MPLDLIGAGEIVRRSYNGGIRVEIVKEVALWPQTDVPIALAHVCLEGKGGSGADWLPCR